MRLAIGLAGLLLSCPANAWSQSPPFTPEVSVGAGFGHVFRFEDRAYGGRLNASGSVAVAHRSGWVFELEGHRTRELTPPATPCGIVGVTCLGVGHDGPVHVAGMSAVVHYRFRGRRLRPYLLAGLGALWSTSLHSETRINGDQAVITEAQSRDVGIGPDLGAGLRWRVSPALSLNPEIRWLEGSWRGRENLAVTRVTLRAVYAW